MADSANKFAPRGWSITKLGRALDKLATFLNNLAPRRPTPRAEYHKTLLGYAEYHNLYYPPCMHGVSLAPCNNLSTSTVAYPSR